MKNENITGGLGKLKQDLAGMTLREKAEHIWTYYRSWVIVAVAVVMVISILCTSLINLSKETMISGVCINASLQDDAKDYLLTGMKERLNLSNSRQAVYFEQAYIDFQTDPENAYYLIQNMFSLMASQELDFMIIEKSNISSLLTQDPFMDLREVFTEEEMKDLKIENTKASEDAEPVPTLVDISDWPIVKQSENSDKAYYFVVIGNTPRLEAVKTAFDHLQNYGK